MIMNGGFLNLQTLIFTKQGFFQTTVLAKPGVREVAVLFLILSGEATDWKL